MFQTIQSLLKDAQFRQTLQSVTNVAEAVQLIVAAGAAKGYNLTQEVVAQAVAQMQNFNPTVGEELSEDALEAVAGGLLKSSTIRCY